MGRGDRGFDQRTEMELLQMQRAQIWFLEAVKQSGFELYERTITMLEGALHHQAEGNGMFSSSYTPVRKHDGLPVYQADSPGT